MGKITEKSGEYKMYKVNGDMGCYNMGFLTMHLDHKIGDLLNWNEFDDETKSTFIHEYIHYIQEISTLQGVSLYTYDASNIIACINVLVNKGNETIEIPIILENEKIENSEKQQYLVDVYKGDTSIDNSSNKKIHHINKIAREIDYIAKECIDMDIPLYNIYYDDKKEPIRLGNFIISESMAYLVEKQLGYTNIVRKKEFPYNMCELIVESIYSDLKSNTICLIAISEIAMMDYYSGALFIEIIHKMKEKNFLPKNSADVVNFFKSEFTSVFDYLISQYNKKIQSLFNKLNILYPMDKEVGIFNSINRQLRNKFNDGKFHRNKSICLVAEELERSSKSEFVENLINTFGCPLIIDNTFDIYVENNMKYYDFMLVPYAMYYLFNDVKDECPLRKYCEMRITNNKCINKKKLHLEYIMEYANMIESGKCDLNYTTCIISIYWYLRSLPTDIHIFSRVNKRD